jgi:hypothetical protein
MSVVSSYSVINAPESVLRMFVPKVADTKFMELEFETQKRLEKLHDCSAELIQNKCVYGINKSRASLVVK